MAKLRSRFPLIVKNLAWFSRIRTQLRSLAKAKQKSAVSMAGKEVQDFYRKARKCIDVDHPLDPVGEPFRSLHCAAEHFQNALDALKSRADRSELEQLALAQILHELGLIEVLTDEKGTGERKWDREALEILKSLPNPTDAKSTSAVAGPLLQIAVLNLLASTESTRMKMEAALRYLKDADALYNRLVQLFKSGDDLDSVIHHLTYLLGDQPVPERCKYSVMVEEQGTKTKYYLSQCYQHLGQKENAAMYCHLTLKKQIKFREILSFFDPIDWAVNAVALSQFFLEQHNFPLSLHLLACAEAMLAEARAKSSTEEAETLKVQSANLARCWVNYGTVLLEASRLVKLKLDSGVPVDVREVQSVPVKLIDTAAVSALEREWPMDLVHTFEEARQVFLSAQKRITEAMAVYTIRDHPSAYIQVIQNSSKLYQALAVFESAVDRKCKMNKRRIDLLEDAVKALHIETHPRQLQALRFELGDVYMEMVELKFSVLPSGMLKPTDGPVIKINQLIEKGIAHFQEYLNLVAGHIVKGGSPQDIPKWEDVYVRSALLARYSIGRLQSKRIVGHPRERFENLEKWKKCYEEVEAYIKKYPEHEQLLSAELQAIRTSAEVLLQQIQDLLTSGTVA